MISLKYLLQIPHFSDLTLVTEEHTLDNLIVKSVEITETPDVEHFIPSNVLLLSTGMVFKDNQKDLIPFMDSLIRAKSIGLAIKTSRFLNTIDPDVIAYANKVGFPLLIIPDKYTLGSLLHQMMNIVLKNQKEEIDFALNIQKSFSNLLVQDASNDLLIRELSHSIKTPIILLDPFKEVIASSHHFKNNEMQAQHYITSLFNELKETKRKDGSFIIDDLDGSKKHLSLVQIKNFAYFPHYLIIVSPEQVPFPSSIFAIEQAAMVFQFNLYKNQKVDESIYATEAHFFNDLIVHQTQENGDWENWLQVGKNYDYIQSNFYQVINIFSKNQKQSSHSNLKLKEMHFLSYRWLRENINNYFDDALVIWRSELQEIVLILQSKPSNLENKLIEIAKNINKLINNKLIFSVGYEYSNWQRIEQSYTQSKMARDESLEIRDDEMVIFYRDKGMFQLFNTIDNSKITYFCKSILKDLAYPESGSMIDLRDTLDVYLQNQSEITQTAKDLFIHRNTVKYRINRCEEILDVDLNSPEDSLNLRLALNLSNKNSV